MTRVFGLLTLLSGLLLASLAGTAQEPKGPRLPDPEAAFRLGDTNKDGKLSKDEFRKLLAAGPRIRDNPQLADGLFDRLDTNKDGFLTPDEYKKVAELRGPGAFRPGEKKGEEKKAEEKKVEEKKPVVAEEKAEPVFRDEKPPTAEQVSFFEKKIRPVLVAQCYGCHAATAEKVKGGLVLDTRDGIRKGGETAPAVIPGDVKKSLLLHAIKYQDDELKMPPKQKLSDEIIADFEKWIAMGAPDPREGTTKTGKNEIDIEKGRKFWSFQPPKKVTPTVKGTWARTDIDRYILSGLEEKGLKPVADTDRATLVRRLYFDLIGLPPSPEEQAEAEKLSLEQLVDKLLASPHFGERWGRHWLDVVRYAESSGKTVNMNYPHAWRYRDYVIAAFNSDKPYDQFIKEQLAGDLMPTDDAKKKAERIVATGFLAIGSKALNERSGLQFELDNADEQIDVTTQAFLGLTAACARCHDHKFDPIPQKDYYALSGIFRSTETCYGTIRLIQSNRPSPTIALPKDSGMLPGTPETLTAAEKTRIEKQITDLNKQIAEATDPIRTLFTRNQVSLLRSKLDSFDSEGNPKLLAMGVRDKPAGRGGPGGFGPGPGGFGPRGGFGGTNSIADSPLYERGETEKPSTARVPRGALQVLSTAPLKISSGQSGRLDLANAIASKDNPLTARVMANRVWVHLFGHGIVPTADNFGAAGEVPTNQELLDYLAIRFVDNGWSVKKLIREIVLSRSYQLASTHDEKCFAVDPDNALGWRMSKRRLDAEPLHDAMLTVAGRLDTKPPVGTSVSRQGEGNATGRGRFGGPGLRPEDRHRTVYLPILRDNLPEELALFDFPDPSMVTGERSTTTIPAQSLYLMNNSFVIRQSEATADRVLATPGTEEEKIRFAYKLCFARPPSDKETRSASDFLKRYAEATSGTRTAGAERAKKAAWSALCQALFASAEFSNLN